MSDIYIPADYAVDAFSLEVERRRKVLGRPYSYGQLIADTTPGEREEIAEDYRKALVKAKRQGRHRVAAGSAITQERSDREMEEQVLDRMTKGLTEDPQ